MGDFTGRIWIRIGSAGYFGPRISADQCQKGRFAFCGFHIVITNTLRGFCCCRGLISRTQSADSAIRWRIVSNGGFRLIGVD
ncbi:hypothetical protein FKM82_025652 [Ascaphus truei]